MFDLKVIVPTAVGVLIALIVFKFVEPLLTKKTKLDEYLDTDLDDE